MLKRCITVCLLLSTLGCATIHRHPKLTAVIAVSVPTAIVVGLTMRGPHCNHYEPGNNGVGMPCPVEPKSDAK